MSITLTSSQAHGLHVSQIHHKDILAHSFRASLLIYATMTLLFNSKLGSAREACRDWTKKSAL